MNLIQNLSLLVLGWTAVACRYLVIALRWLTLTLAALALIACTTTPPEVLDYPQPTPTASPQPAPPQVAGEPGELLWRHEIGGVVGSAPTVADGVVYFGSEDHHVYALGSRNRQGALALSGGA